jgi:hypothetical protein
MKNNYQVESYCKSERLDVHHFMHQADGKRDNKNKTKRGLGNRLRSWFLNEE